ncbi:hypothetical protein [Pseudorhodobacter aquimaris]|uniref:hypothetical protein n=1 Tax=Pseudorhodobacter aquimaris TaxID=687412 RepID=UPI000AE6343C|nr:hypothetical protein [Pseudorhodobacter aquimaris]
MAIEALGIDLGKTVCSLVGYEAEKVVSRKRLQRHRLLDFRDERPPYVDAMGGQRQ